MKEKLLEISIIRPVLIFIFLIGYHAFAPWGGRCMGVYIFHNFIFRIIYDMTPVPYLLPSLLLPWVAYITSLALGVVLTRISVHIPLLRSLI